MKFNPFIFSFSLKHFSSKTASVFPFNSWSSLSSLAVACQLLGALLCSGELSAQSAVYSGYRMAAFGFEIRQINARSVLLECNLANTGRLSLQLPERASETVIELDSMTLPTLLYGHEQAIQQALSSQKVNMAAGEIQQRISVRVNIDEFTVNNYPDQGPGVCPDLRFDTAYMTYIDEQVIVVRYAVRNFGDQSAWMLGERGELAPDLLVNGYYISGQKMTRGALPAGSELVKLGRETLDGWLHPGQVFWGEIRLDAKKRTRFSPNVALELDPFLVVQECNRTNNTVAVSLE
ncbi:MAG: hypothetical protein IT269_11280, partial [Saprospiraceae bacterium]|nr:hypothetical protein [Saprospiraceae bacterium]